MSKSENLEVVFPMKAAKDYKAYLEGDVLDPIRSRLDENKTVAIGNTG